ncbi:MAG: hypothetical protein ACTSXU_12420, partial [Promethearchaeota archaeon]
DLAGQENEKWFGSEYEDIFCYANDIIVVLEATARIKDIRDFIWRVINKRRELKQESIIHVLIHKIDLIKEDELERKKKELKSEFKDINKFKIEFTSIKGQYFLRSISVFEEIINMVLEHEILPENFDYNRIRKLMDILIEFRSTDIIALDELKEKLGIENSDLHNLLDLLKERRFIREININGTTNIQLDIDNKKDFLRLIDWYAGKRLNLFLEQYLSVAKQKEGQLPYFIGFFIADKYGTPLLMTEVFPGIFEAFLGLDKDSDTINLIPAFISALDNFSKEIHLVDMSDIKIKGRNLSLYIFSIKNLTITIFMTKNTNIDSVKQEIISYFMDFIKNNEDLIQEAIKTKLVSKLSKLENETRVWLTGLNDRYDKRVKNLEVFDYNFAKSLYEKLEDFSLNPQYQDIKIQGKLAQMRKKLVSAMLEKNLTGLIEVSNIYNELKKG